MATPVAGIAKIPNLPQLDKVPLSFLDHYWSRPSSWTLSGSCPLCLTPPCYHLEPPATAAPFCPISGQVGEGREFHGPP
jgi:hypothetical protein